MLGLLRLPGKLAGAITSRSQQLLRWVWFNLMYFGRPPWDTGVTPPELEVFIRRHPPGRAIDLGCGTGTNLLALARAGWQVTGIDMALRAVLAARRRLARENQPGEVRVGDVTHLETIQGSHLNSGYNLVLDIGCYHGLPHDRRAVYRANLPAILAPKGYFMIYAHLRRDGQTESSGIARQDFEGFRQILDLVERQDSQDRWGRSATWMIFQNR